MSHRRNGCVLTIAGALLAGAAASQTTHPAAPATSLPQTRPAPAVTQPAEFLALAAKARQIKAVHVKGRGVVTGENVELPKHLKEFTFEIWARPPAAKTRLDIPAQEVRLCDGKHVYTYRAKTPAGPRGRRRTITPGNFYHAIGLAAVVVDAANGYASLSKGVRFVPAAEVPEYAEKFPSLKWFQLKPVGSNEPPHHLFRETSQVKVGISAVDGLPRVLTATLSIKEPKPTSTVLFEAVQPRKIEDESLKLPPEAALAAWRDADTGKSVSVPKALIAAKKP